MKCAVATHFVSDIFRQLQGFGTTLIEFHLQTDQTLGIEVCQKLGFEEIDQGVLFRKAATS